MAKYGKWIGGGLGWAFGGPIGALVGFLAGSLFDTAEGSQATIGQGNDEEYRQQSYTRPADFQVSLLVLAAAVMKADGRHLKSELDYIKRFLITNFGEARTLQYLQVLKELLDKDFSVRQVSLQIRQHLDHPARLQLMHFLYGIAAADGEIDVREGEVLHHIAEYLYISPADQASLKAMFIKDRDSAYKILEIDRGVSDDEVKKAYRKMAAKYHPDKVATLGEEAMKAAQEKFREVNQAYEEIKKERAMK